MKSLITKTLQHTPAPWEAGKMDTLTYRINAGPYNRIMAEIRCINGTEKPTEECDSEAEANAKLMAAAPEMLKSLISLYELSKNPFSTSDENKQFVWAAAEYAIEKATL